MTRKRSDRGSGAIFRDAERGGYRLQITLDGKRYVRRGKTRAEVIDKRAALLREQARGELSVDRQATVGSIVDRYVDRVVPNRKGGTLAPSTLARYKWAAEHLNRELGTKKAATLTTREVEAALDRLAATPFSRDSLSKIHRVLVAALDDAVRRSDLVRNPAAPAHLPPAAKQPRRRQSLSPTDAGRLLDALDDERLGALFAMMLLLGLRPSEAAATYWEAIDGHVVNVTRSVRHNRGRPEIVESLKTAGAARTLEMPDDLVDMLDRHRARQAAERLAAPTWIHPELVFTTAKGGVLTNTQLNRELRDLCRRLNVKVDGPNGRELPDCYVLRHSCASLLSDRGVPNETIADLLGHTSTRMVDQTYRHRLRPTVAAARDQDWRTAAGN